MSDAEERDEQTAADAARDLAHLHRQVSDAREELSRLRHELDVTGTVASAASAAHSADLREANEQLIVAAVQAQDQVEDATHALNIASRAAGLDSLTALPNRVLMLDRLQHAIAGAKRRGSRVALLFVDLDNFKSINDELGHSTGDRVLRLAAAALLGTVRDADTVSRHGGDEFLILLAEVAAARDAVVVAEKALAALAACDTIGPFAIHLDASIGISLYPDHAAEPDELIDRADAAMYRAKRQGAGRVVVFGEPAETSAVPGAAERTTRPPGTRAPLSMLRQAHERSYALLREANERLVLSALDAHELQDAAERALRQQSEFLARAAHELRNPLGPIRFASAQLGMSRTDTKALGRALAVIDRQVAQIAHLIGDLIDVSRLKTGKLRVEHQRVELGAIVDGALEGARPTIDSRLQRLHVVRPSHPLHLDGDAVRLQQVFANLLDNASKFTPEGGSLALHVAEGAGEVVCTLTDSGIGIPADGMHAIFDLFTQDALGLTVDGSGLGIGLTVVRELVEAHGGTVSASSEGRGMGSRFVVTLPMAE